MKLSHNEASKYLAKLSDEKANGSYQVWEDCVNQLYTLVKVIKNPKTHTSHTVSDITETTLNVLFNKVLRSYE